MQISILRLLSVSLLFCFFAGTVDSQTPVLRNPVSVSGVVQGELFDVAMGGDYPLEAVAFIKSDSTGFSGFEVFVACSQDGGLSFGPALRVDTDSTGSVKYLRDASESVLVAGQRIYVFWSDFRFGPQQSSIFLNISADGGASYQPVETVLDDGAQGANFLIRQVAAVSPDPTGDHVYCLMTSRLGSNGGDELFLVASHDGGTTFSSAIQIAGNTPTFLGIQDIALVVDGLDVHVAYVEFDGLNNISHAFYQQSIDGGATFLSSPIQLDSSAIGTSRSDVISLAREGDLLAVAWNEEPVQFLTDELRVSLSIDGGQSFGPSFRVGGYDPNADIVSANDLFLDGGRLFVSWSDNRDRLGYRQMFVAKSDDKGASFSESEIIGLEGGQVPKIFGTGDNIVVGYQGGFATEYSAAAFSVDGGDSWSAALELSDPTPGSGLLAFSYVPELENFIAVYDETSTEFVAGGFALCDEGSSVQRNVTPNPQSLSAGGPLLGATWTATVDLGLTGHSLACLMGYASPLQFTLPGGQVVLVNPLDPGGELLQMPASGGPIAAFSGLVPTDPGLCGFSFSAQAVHLGGMTPFALSNALDLVIAAL